MKQEHTAAEVRDRLSYEPETGLFRYKDNPEWSAHIRARDLGRVAGSIRADGYVRIMLDGVHYFAHRLAWVYMTGGWPEGEIDHEDLDSGNNRWTNLRPADSAGNKWNTGKRASNTSGFKGVDLYRPTGRWRARIKCRGKQINLGYFATPEEAHAAYVEAAVRLHGEFARAA